MNRFFATIGFFDGVHCGHRCLLDQLIEAAAATGAVPMVVTFRNHPRKVIGGKYTTPPLLTTSEERIQLLRKTGISHVEVLDFTPQMARLTAAEFMREVLRPLGVCGLLMGFNHHFGSDRTTTFETLQAQALKLGITIHRAQPLEQGADVSSTVIRLHIAAGQMDEAARLLGHPYTLTGQVVHGNQIGRGIGFPTANVEVPTEKLIPADGVYFGRTSGAETCLAIINIGTRPTIEAHGGRTIEAHLLDYEGDLYGQSLTLSIEHFHRVEQHFNSLDQLKTQLQADEQACRKRYHSQP